MYRIFNIKGMTLVETMMAIALFGIVVISFFSAINGYQRINNTNLTQLRMMEIARAEVEKIKSDPNYSIPSDNGKPNNTVVYYPASSTSSSDEQKYGILYNKEPTYDPDKSPSGFLLEITVGPYNNSATPLDTNNPENYTLTSWLPTTSVSATPFTRLRLIGIPNNENKTVQLTTIAKDNSIPQKEYDVTDFATYSNADGSIDWPPFIRFDAAESKITCLDKGEVTIKVNYLGLNSLLTIIINSDSSDGGGSITNPTPNDVAYYIVSATGFLADQGGYIDGRTIVFSPTIINQSLVVTDDAYYASNLNINQNVVYHKDVYIKGNATFNQHVTIKGNLYIEGELNYNQGLTVEGEIIRGNVTIPTLTMPDLRDDSWYLENGFTVVSSKSQKVNLVPGGKYYFKVDYTFNKEIKNLQDVVIAAKGDLCFNQGFGSANTRNSGMLFVPNGKLTFNQRCSFEGIIAAGSTNFNQEVNLKYDVNEDLTFPFEVGEELNIEIRIEDENTGEE